MALMANTGGTTMTAFTFDTLNSHVIILNKNFLWYTGKFF